MKRTFFVSVLFGLSLATPITGCSRAATVCQVICECEHCNDQAEIEACNQLETAEDVASAYDCSEKWEAYGTCVEERGVCDSKEARFSTRDDMGEDRCQDEADALDACIDNASAHEGTSGNFN